MNGQTESQWGVPAGGVFTDSDYARLQKAGRLFVSRPDGKDLRFEQAHLVVHVGAEIRTTFEQDSEQVIELGDGEEIEVPPRGVAVVTTAEAFELPASVQGQVSPRGKLTTVGFAFPTTHVDPGFRGPLYLPFVNSGERAVKLKQGRPIGKVELQALHLDVDTPWFEDKAKPSFATLAEDLLGERPEEEPSDEGGQDRQDLKIALGLVIPPALLGYGVMLVWLAGKVADILRDVGVDWSDVATEVVSGLIVAVLVGLAALLGRYLLQRRDKERAGKTQNPG